MSPMSQTFYERKVNLESQTLHTLETYYQMPQISSCSKSKGQKSHKGGPKSEEDGLKG